MLGGGSSSVADDASTSSALVEVHNSGGLFEDDRDNKGDRSSVGGNRWPSQETIALLQIRSDMDLAFRDSTLKGPLWDDISRKMGELGFNRSAKKCREKFENVYKYHRRTKDSRATKSKNPDNKSYRFFDQLEALDQLQPNNSSSFPPVPPPPQQPRPLLPTGGYNNSTVSSILDAANSTTTVPLQPTPTPAFAFGNSTIISFSCAATTPIAPPIPATRLPATIHTVPQSPPSSSPTWSDNEGFVEVGINKRKRKWKQLFGRLMNDVLEKQERLQKRFLEAIEKREHDRILREESWKMQEMDRMNREHDILARERSSAAAKDAAVISFLQNIFEQQNSNQDFFRPQPPPGRARSETRSKKAQGSQTLSQDSQQQSFHSHLQLQLQTQPALEPQTRLQHEQQQHQQQQKLAAPAPSQPPPPPPLPQTRVNELKESPKSENNGGNVVVVASPSRWPKAEINALINLRTNMDLKYHENGPKGPLWEDISLGMAKIGYNRSAKRCKEKWENINKYFKKVKDQESKRSRTQDSKTCPYFHLLDAIYKEKCNQMVPIMVQPEQQWPLQPQDLQHLQQKTSARENDENDDDHHDDDGNNDSIVGNVG